MLNSCFKKLFTTPPPPSPLHSQPLGNATFFSERYFSLFLFLFYRKLVFKMPRKFFYKNSILSFVFDLPPLWREIESIANELLLLLRGAAKQVILVVLGSSRGQRRAPPSLFNS